MAGALLGSRSGSAPRSSLKVAPLSPPSTGTNRGGSDVPGALPRASGRCGRPGGVGGGLRVPGPSLPARPNPAQPSPRRARTPGLPGRGARLRGRLGLSGAQRSLLPVPVLLLFWFWARPRPPGGRLRFPLRSRPGGPSPVLSSPLLSPCAQGLGARAGWGAAAGDSGCAARPLAMAPRTSLRGAVTARRARRARLCPARPRLVRAATCGPRSRRSPGRSAHLGGPPGPLVGTGCQGARVPVPQCVSTSPSPWAGLQCA